MRATTLTISVAFLLACHGGGTKRSARSAGQAAATSERVLLAKPQGKPPAPALPSASNGSVSDVVVHNVTLRLASPIRLKVKYLRGKLYPTDSHRVPSFDDDGSFRLEIEEGLLGISLRDLTQFLQSGRLERLPIGDPKVTEQKGKLKITGKLRRAIPLPISMLASVGVAPDRHHVRMHVEHVSVLKVPVKGLMNTLALNVENIFKPDGQKGFSVAGNDIDIDVSQVLPPPTATGELTRVSLWPNGDLMEYYGSPRADVMRRAPWRNFMRVRGGTVSFGKLTMHNTDLLLVDSSPGDWLNFDIPHYQEQLVSGTTRITPSGGLQIFIPDFDKLPASLRRDHVNQQWMKSREVDPPVDAQ